MIKNAEQSQLEIKIYVQKKNLQVSEEAVKNKFSVFHNTLQTFAEWDTTKRKDRQDGQKSQFFKPVQTSQKVFLYFRAQNRIFEP